MSSLFFDHLINISQLEQQIKQLEITDQELYELNQELDQLIQQRVVEVVLNLLHQDHHHTFITYLHQNPSDTQILIWLKQYITDVEEQIQQAVSELEQELLQEILSAQE